MSSIAWKQRLWLAISQIVGAAVLLAILAGTQTMTSSPSAPPIRISFGEDVLLTRVAQEVAAKDVIIMGEEILLPISTPTPEASGKDSKTSLQAFSDSGCSFVVAKVSAYNSLAEQTDDDPWSGAYGTVGPGSIAADPKMIKPHSRVFVPGYGWGNVRDTGAAVIASGSAGVYHVDVWMDGYEQAIAWGIQWLEIQICRPERV